MPVKRKTRETKESPEAEPKMGKMPTNKPLMNLDPVGMEQGFIRVEDIQVGSDGRYYVRWEIPVTSKPSEPHGFLIPIQNVDCGKYVIMVPIEINVPISDKNMNDRNAVRISGVSFEPIPIPPDKSAEREPV